MAMDQHWLQWLSDQKQWSNNRLVVELLKSIQSNAWTNTIDHYTVQKYQLLLWSIPVGTLPANALQWPGF